MVRSMTGFGRGEAQNEVIHFTVEIKTVNHRYFEPSIRLSKRFGSLENELRTFLSQQIVRGKTDVFVTYEEIQTSSQVILHEDALEQYLLTLRQAAEKYGLEDDLKISNVLSLNDVLEVTQKQEDPLELWPVLKEAAQKAVDQLNEMRSREGARIAADLLEKADLMSEIVAQLKEAAPQIEEKYYQKLQTRIQDILSRLGGQTPIDKGLLENEVAIFADRVCIDEEMVRLTSHITELKRLLGLDEPVGRSLDFLLQEFNRESNTIASKAADLSVTQSALQLKKEIEKVREQIQNLE